LPDVPALQLSGCTRTNSGGSAAQHPQHGTINIKAYADGPFDKVASEYPAVSRQLKDPMRFWRWRPDGYTASDVHLRLRLLRGARKERGVAPGDSDADVRLEALDTRQAPYVSEVHHTVWHYLPGLSNNMAAADITHSHYWDVMIFHMRPGRGEQFAEITNCIATPTSRAAKTFPGDLRGMLGVTDAYLVLVPMSPQG